MSRMIMSYTTVLKKFNDREAFYPSNDQFWKNIMKLASSHDQELVNSIQTLITLKTREKSISHTFVDNYEVFLIN